MAENDNLVSWSWWIPAAGAIASHRGTAHRGPTATRVANHIKDYIKIDKTEGTLTFQPHGGSDVTTVIRTRQKVPQSKPVYIFEVHVISAQAATPSSKIAVGVQFSESILSRLPGAERNSLGVHNDTGLLHSDSSDGTPFFHYGPGDTLTVGINFVTDSISLFKNGLSRGAALVGLPGGGAMYPVVGFDRAEACVAINLGHEPFRYPAVLEALTAEATEHVLLAINSTSPPLLSGSTAAGATAPPSVAPTGKSDSKKKKVPRDREGREGDKGPANKSGGGKGASGKDAKRVSGDNGKLGAATTQIASIAHTAQLRAILDHLVHASCWKSADAVAKIISRRMVPLQCAVQPEGTLEASFGGVKGAHLGVGASAAPMDLEAAPLRSLSGETLVEMQQRHAVMELMLSGRVEQVRIQFR